MRGLRWPRRATGCPMSGHPPHSLQALQARHGPRLRWLLLMTVMIGTMASVMSSTIMNVAIPDMSRHFTLGQSRVQWVSSGFMVAMMVSMLTTPWLLARYGYRRTYGLCMGVLLVGGVVGGLANDYPLVLLARVVEGMAAGAVQPIPAIIILRAFDAHEQGRASAVFGTGVVLGPAIGPSIGGLLVDLLGWRSIFFMVVPLCLLGLWLSRRYVPDSAPGGVPAQGDSPAIDTLGMLLVALATLALLNGMVQWQAGNTWPTLALLGGAVLGMLGFVAWQRHLLQRWQAGRRRPLMNLKVFGQRNFSMGSLVALTYGMALFGSTYLLPVYMQVGLGLSPSYIGAALLPAGLLLSVTIALVGRMADRAPTHRLVTVGLLLLALSFALMPTVHPARGLALLWAWVILGRIGLGFVLPSLNLSAMKGMPPPLIPQGASTFNFMRMLGGAVGVGLCAVVLDWRLQAAGVPSLWQVQAGDPLALRAFHEAFAMLAGLTALSVLAALQLAPRSHKAP